MQKHSLLSLLAVAFLLSACSVMGIKKHQPNFKNVRELEAVKGSFRVESVTANAKEMQERLATSSLSCRLTTFNMPPDKNVAAFLQEALTDEFDAARKLAPNGTPVGVVVKDLTSDTSGFSRGTWTLDFDYLVKGKTYSVKTVTEFESAYAADTACRNTASALTDAVGENFAAFYKKLPR